MIFLSLYVFLRFLTWRARHSQPLFATRIFFLFCNQLAFEGLVIRRAVEMVGDIVLHHGLPRDVTSAPARSW